MKKWLAILGIVTCVFSLTACGSTSSRIEGTSMAADEEASWVESAESLVDDIQMIAEYGMEDEVADNAVYSAAVQSWESSVSDFGEVVGYQDEYAVYSDSDEVSIVIGIDGTEHDGEVVIVAEIGNDGATLSSVTTNVDYTFGELIEQAALNTVLGMGTTFVILILLAFLISRFVYIGKIQESMAKKKEAPAAAAPAAAAPAAPAAAEPAVDDGELIAVIAAAIAASEGKTSTDGFVVRSIRKARKKQ